MASLSPSDSEVDFMPSGLRLAAAVVSAALCSGCLWGYGPLRQYESEKEIEGTSWGVDGSVEWLTSVGVALSKGLAVHYVSK